MQYKALDGTVHDKKEDAVFASVQHQLRNQLIEQLTDRADKPQRESTADHVGQQRHHDRRYQ